MAAISREDEKVPHFSKARAGIVVTNDSLAVQDRKNHI
jgi:hypothetical protein